MKDKNENKDGYKLTKLGWIPEDWEIGSIGESLIIENNKRKPISEEDRKKISGKYPYYGPTRIQDYINEYQYEGEYVLIAEDGDHFLKYRDFPMTQLVNGKFNVNNHAHVIKGNSKCRSKWFFWFYNHRNVFSHLTRQGAGRYKLNKAALEKMLIAFPSPSEQDKIICIIDIWDHAFQILTQLIEQKKQRKKWLMQVLLTGKKRLPGFFENWERMKIRDIASEISLRNSNNGDFTVLSCTKYDGLVPSLEYFGRKIYSDNLDSYKVVPKGHYAYATNHIEEGSIGYQSDFDKGLISPMYTVFKTNELINDDFFFPMLKSYKLVHEYQRRMEGSINRRGGLRWEGFSSIPISIPTVEEQTAIANVLITADKEIEILTQKLDFLKDQKKGLMQQLLTGRKRLDQDLQD